MTMGKGGDRRPRVVVVGGGFAGVSAVRELSGADVDVLLLDRNLYNTFQPLLYQVAAGGLNPGDITYALRAFAARHGNARFRRACVSGVDAARRCVRTDTGEEILDARSADNVAGSTHYELVERTVVLTPTDNDEAVTGMQRL